MGNAGWLGMAGEEGDELRGMERTVWRRGCGITRSARRLVLDVTWLCCILDVEFIFIAGETLVNYVKLSC
jgi:hypothetical protein